MFDDAAIRGHLDTCAEANQVFVVLASPVAEVGRDHDYDWAVIEPSSMRSIIQIAGRVRRHRPAKASNEANIILLDRNWRDVDGRDKDGLAFRYPGFEGSGGFKLKSHRLTDLLMPADLEPLTSAPRIASRMTVDPRNNLVDLEHARLGMLMLADEHSANTNVRRWWESAAALTATLQRSSPFRASEAQQTFVLFPDEDHAAGWSWRLLQDDGTLSVGGVGSRFDSKKLGQLGQRMQHWLAIDYLGSLAATADDLGISTELAARRYGTTQLPATTSRSSKNASTWFYHPALGMRRNTG